MRRQQKYIDMLKKHAEQIEEPVRAYRHAAAVVIKNKVVGIGTNSYKSHPFATKYSHRDGAIYLHAETSAIKDALRHVSVEELSKATLYVARIKRPTSKSDAWMNAMSKPCDGCARCIVDFGIKKVVYTTDGGVDVL